MQAGLGPLEEAQRQAEAAAATLIERKFKEPANLEVGYHLQTERNRADATRIAVRVRCSFAECCAVVSSNNPNEVETAVPLFSQSASTNYSYVRMLGEFGFCFVASSTLRCGIGVLSLSRKQPHCGWRVQASLQQYV